MAMVVGFAGAVAAQSRATVVRGSNENVMWFTAVNRAVDLGELP
jgi:hypothetical protein